MNRLLIVSLVLVLTACSSGSNMPATTTNNTSEVDTVAIKQAKTAGLRSFIAYRVTNPDEFRPGGSLVAIEPGEAIEWHELRMVINMDLRTIPGADSSPQSNAGPLGPPDDPVTVEKIVNLALRSDVNYSDSTDSAGVLTGVIEIAANVSNFFETSPLLAADRFQTPSAFIQAIEDVPGEMTLRLTSPPLIANTHVFSVFVSLDDGREFETSTEAVAISP